MTKSGRKHSELVARLSELSILLTAHGGAHGSYEKGFAGFSPAVLATIDKVVLTSMLIGSAFTVVAIGTLQICCVISW